MNEIKNTYICPLCGAKTKDYFLVMGSSLIESASDIRCSNKQCFFSSNYVPHRTWRHIADVKKNELNLQSENRTLRTRIAELERSAIVWHKYPDEKPDMDVKCLVMFDDGEPIISSFDCFNWSDIEDAWVGRITHWAYLPEPPKEEG